MRLHILSSVLFCNYRRKGLLAESPFLTPKLPFVLKVPCQTKYSPSHEKEKDEKERKLVQSYCYQYSLFVYLHTFFYTHSCGAQMSLEMKTDLEGVFFQSIWCINNPIVFLPRDAK